MKNSRRDSFDRISEDMWELAERMEETLIEEFCDEATTLIARYKQQRDRAKAQDEHLVRHMDRLLWVWTNAESLTSEALDDFDKRRL